MTKDIRVYHNPRCAKSRAALAFLEERGLEFELIRYFDEPFTRESLKDLLGKLDMNAEDLLRKNEQYFKAHLKGQELGEADLINHMVKEPKLIERPIVLRGAKAVIGRPTEKISELL